MTQLKYTFNNIVKCNFCHKPTIENKIIGQRLNKSQGFDPKGKIGISVSVIKCNHCGLIYSNPQPLPNDIQDHYGVPPESYWSSEYFAYNPNYFSREIAIAKKLVSFQNGMSALDVGAGLGKGMISLEKSGFEAFGLEPSIPFRDNAINKMNINPERLTLGSIEQINYDTNSFDFITFGAVLEHLYTPAESLEKAFRWLKPNGVIQIEVPSSKWLMSRIINFYFKIRGTNYVTHLSPMHEPYHLYEFDLKSFEALSNRLNFEIAQYEYFVCSIYQVPKMFHPILKWYMKKTNQGMQLSIWLRKK